MLFMYRICIVNICGFLDSGVYIYIWIYIYKKYICVYFIWWYDVVCKSILFLSSWFFFRNVIIFLSVNK